MSTDDVTWQVVVLGAGFGGPAASRHAHLAGPTGRTLCGATLRRHQAEDPTLPHATRCRECLEQSDAEPRALDYP